MGDMEEREKEDLWKEEEKEIMKKDKYKKVEKEKVMIGKVKVKINGIEKGEGMIEKDMEKMI